MVKLFYFIYLLLCFCPIINIYNLGSNIFNPILPTFFVQTTHSFPAELQYIDKIAHESFRVLECFCAALHLEICSFVFKYLDLLLSDLVHFLSRITFKITCIFLLVFSIPFQSFNFVFAKVVLQYDLLPSHQKYL